VVLFRKTHLDTYKGVLVSEELLTLFNQQYHCPTAVRIHSLDYKDPAGRPVSMLLIGDPNHAASIINDGVGRKKSQSTGQQRRGQRRRAIVMSVC
jgi:hypothetical protein